MGDEFIIRNTWRQFTFVFAALVSLVGTSEAQFREGPFCYDFVAEEEQAVLARLELSVLPATDLAFVRLSFTGLGEEIFVLGPMYIGEFDEMVGPAGSSTFVSLGDGLSGTDPDGSQIAIMRDLAPPMSSLPQVQTMGTLDLTAWEFDQLDSIAFDFRDANGERQAVGRLGNWKAVPEPAALPIAERGSYRHLF